MKCLKNYFRAEFKAQDTEFFHEQENVYKKYSDVSKHILIMEEVFNEFQVRKYAKCLKSETSRGFDGF